MLPDAIATANPLDGSAVIDGLVAACMPRCRLDAVFVIDEYTWSEPSLPWYAISYPPAARPTMLGLVPAFSAMWRFCTPFVVDHVHKTPLFDWIATAELSVPTRRVNDGLVPAIMPRCRLVDVLLRAS